MKTPSILPASLFAGIALVLAAPLARAQANGGAQTASTSAGTPAPDSGEVVTLPVFDVTSDPAHGYVASESETGTRVASKIADLPFVVDVVTRPFIKDFAEYTMNDQLAFVAGFSPSEVTGQYQLRGFSSPVELVDGFRRIGLIDTIDVDRVEVIKGPDASIYGAIQPGGVVNYITRQPTTVPSGELDIDAGSFNFLEASFSTSGPINKAGTLFYRIDGANSFTNYAEAFASQHQDFLDGKILWKPSASTSASFDFEHVERYEHPFNQILTITEKRTMPWAGNSITESQYYGMAIQQFHNYDYAGPESTDEYRVTSGTFTLQHSFNDIWSLKLGANAFTNPYHDQLVGSGAFYPYGTGNITFAADGVTITNPYTPEVKDQPQVDIKPQRGGGMQLDNLFAFKAGPISNKLLLTTDYYEVSQRSITLVPLVNGSQATDYYDVNNAYSPANSTFYVPQSTWNAATLGYGWNTTLYGQNPSLYNGITTDQWTASGDYGVFGSEQASMFKDRLILMAGGRWDYVRNQVKNYNIPAVGNPSALETVEPTAYQAFDYNTAAWTYQLGAMVKVTDWLSLFANKSTAFNPQPQIDSNTGLALPNNTSSGYDYGIKSGTLGGRLNVTLDRFSINEYNLALTETDPVTSIKDTILSGELQAKGYEFDFNYQINGDLMLFGDWGYTDTITVNSYAITFLDDLPVRRVPRDNAGIGLRYQISHGPVRGLFFVADARYDTKSLVNLGSGKSLIPGPAGSTVGSTSTMYYVPGVNLTYATGKDPKGANETKITGTPVINVPFPGNGQLPYPSLGANSLINFPMSATGQPLVLQNPAVPGVYVGEAEGVFVDDGRVNNYNAPYAVFDVGTGFTWKTRRFTNTLQVNIKNLLNRQYTWGSGVPGLDFQAICSYTIQY
jgi:outer membrane receptor protein involved in Fe transport